MHNKIKIMNLIILINCLVLVLFGCQKKTAKNENIVPLKESDYLTPTLVLPQELIYNGNRLDKRIYLTFDDGYPAKNTAKILDILKDKNIQVTFFLEGGFLTSEINIVKRIIAEGHIIGCHTWTHSSIKGMAQTALLKEIAKFEHRYEEIIGAAMLHKFFRPPHGFINLQNETILYDLNYGIFLWDVAYIDYERKNDRGVEYAYRSVINQTDNGSIILMHTLTDSNVSALARIIDTLEKNGYCFSSLTDFYQEHI